MLAASMTADTSVVGLPPLFSRHQLDSRAEHAQVRVRLALKGKLLVFKNFIPGTFSHGHRLRHSEESQLAAA